MGSKKDVETSFLLFLPYDEPTPKGKVLFLSQTVKNSLLIYKTAFGTKSYKLTDL